MRPIKAACGPDIGLVVSFKGTKALFTGTGVSSVHLGNFSMGRAAFHWNNQGESGFKGIHWISRNGVVLKELIGSQRTECGKDEDKVKVGSL